MSQADVSTCDSEVATGMQCTCTSLVYLCLTINSSDVDRIIFDGTKLYTTTIHKYFAGKPRYLSIDELPAYHVIRGKRYTLDRLDAITGPRAGLTIVPIVPWHGAPLRQGAPKQTDFFAQMTNIKLQLNCSSSHVTVSP